MTKLLFCSLAFVLVSHTAAVPVKYTDCGSVAGVVHAVDVSPCPLQPCQLPLNSKVTVSLDFTAKSASTAVSVTGTAVVAGIPIDVPLPNPDACQLGVSCPVKPGDHNVLTAELYIEPDFPTISLDFQAKLQDDAGTDMVCVSVPLVIVTGEDGSVSVAAAGEEEPDTVLRFRPHH